MQASLLGGVRVGAGAPVRIMGVINASPESFFKGSVHVGDRALAQAARRMAADGADFIDVGAMSTAPYLTTQISEREEARRLAGAVAAVRRACRLPISADTSRSLPALAALEAGARVLNDVTGLRADARLATIARRFDGVILMAHPLELRRAVKNPISAVRSLLRESVRRASKAGVPRSRLAIDPGIGFFRTSGMPWWKWDVAILGNLDKLAKMNLPVLVGVSRKSFIGKITGEKNPDQRLAGSLAATAAAVLNGAAIIRTHDVKQTVEAVRMAEQLG